MSLRPILLILTCVCFANGCSEGGEIKVSSAYGPGFKLDGIGEAYAWRPSHELPYPYARVENPALQTHIRSEVVAGLETRGFRESADRDPDFWLAYGVARRRVTDVGVSPHGVVREKGSLHLRVVDPASAKVIWQGVAAAQIDPSLPADQRSRRIALAVKKLLERFPDP